MRGTGSFWEVDWPEKARLLAARLPLRDLQAEAVRRLEAVEGSGPIGLACSGGGDSVCLVLLMWAHFPGLRERMRVLHFNHRLRGDASREDADSVATLAAGLRIGFRVGAWEREANIRVNEATARAARFAFFDRALSAGRRWIVLGHNRDDIVESQLMRLSRGSGTAGLAAPRPVHRFREGGVHLRPLLTLSGRRIREELAAADIPFREDLTNAGGRFYRNRLRLELLPRWQRLVAADVSAGAAASRSLLEEDDEALGIWLRESVPEPAPGEPYDLRPAAAKPRALLRRALREWILGEGLEASLSKAAFERLLGAAEAGRSLKMSAGTGAFVELSDDRIVRCVRAGRLEPWFSAPWPLPLGGRLVLPGGGGLEARLFSLDAATRERILGGDVDNRTEAYVVPAAGGLSVRHRRPGDRFRPLGSPGSRKVQDLLIDGKIPKAERDRFPLVIRDGEILWMPHFPPAETGKINTGTKTVVRLTYSCVEAV